MAAYGKGQMLGSGINPESFKQDYSGFANAAAIQAQGLSNLGQSIGGAIDDYGKIKKQQQEDERSVQKSKSVAKAIGDLIPDLKPTLQNSLLLLDNKEIPLSQRKAEADAISDILTLGIGAIGNQQKLALEKAQIEAATNEARLRAANKPMTLAEISMGGGKQQVMLDPITGVATPITLQGFDGQPSTAATGINSALELTGNLKADANAINNAIPLPADFIYTADGSPGSLPPVGTPIAGADASLLPPKPSDVAMPSTAAVLGNNAPQVNPAQTRVGFIPDKTEQARFLTNEEKQQYKIDVNKPFAARFQGDTMISVPEIVKEGELPNKFRPATPEESEPFGGMKGQIDESTGRFYPVQESAPELKLKLLKQAAELYSKGNKAEALQYATAAGIGGLFGNLTISDLDEYFASGAAPIPTEVPAQTTPVERKPLDVIIPTGK